MTHEVLLLLTLLFTFAPFLPYSMALPLAATYVVATYLLFRTSMTPVVTLGLLLVAALNVVGIFRPSHTMALPLVLFAALYVKSKAEAMEKHPKTFFHYLP